MKHENARQHRFRFFRSGGVDQVLVRDGEDLARLRELDLKLWMALSLPTKGTALDHATMDLLDSDGDGRVRPDEILTAIDHCSKSLASLDLLLEPGDAVPLAAVMDDALAASARRLLAALGKPDAAAFTLADVLEGRTRFDAEPLAGDGVAVPDAADGEGAKSALAAFAGLPGAPKDGRGRPGVTAEAYAAFLAKADAFAAWSAEGAASGAAARVDAWNATEAVRARVDDYFTRCRLLSFDPKAAAATPDADHYRAFALATLSAASEELARLPLAEPAPGKPLPLAAGVNPAWADAIAAFADAAVRPIIGSKTELTEADWRALAGALAPCGAWLS